MKPLRFARVFLALGFVVAMSSASAFASDETPRDRKNRISGGPAILFGVGLGPRASYERILVPYLGIGAGASYLTSFFLEDVTTAQFRVTGYLPLEEQFRLYAGLSAGYAVFEEKPFLFSTVTVRRSGFAAEARFGMEVLFNKKFGLALDSTLLYFRDRGYFSPGVEFVFRL